MKNYKVTIFKMLNTRYRALRATLAQMEDMLLSCEVVDQQDKETQAALAREVWDRDYIVYHVRNEKARDVLISYMCEQQKGGR